MTLGTVRACWNTLTRKGREQNRKERKGASENAEGIEIASTSFADSPGELHGSVRFRVKRRYADRIRKRPSD